MDQNGLSIIAHSLEGFSSIQWIAERDGVIDPADSSGLQAK